MNSALEFVVGALNAIAKVDVFTLGYEQGYTDAIEDARKAWAGRKRKK